MLKRLILLAALPLAACQSADPKDYAPDHDCIQRKVGSRLLSKAVGVGAGLLVPGGGLAGRAVGLATDPRCRAFHLTPEAKERIRREGPAWPERPLDMIPPSTARP